MFAAISGEVIMPDIFNIKRLFTNQARLIETQNTISQICFESGNGELLNFYKQFQFFTALRRWNTGKNTKKADGLCGKLS